MDFSEVMSKRKMVRQFTNESIDRAAIERIVAAGSRAPSAGFSQGHRLIVITNPDHRRRIAELARESDWTKKGKPPWLSTAPAHIVLAVDVGAYRSRYGEPDKRPSDGGHPVDAWDVPYWWVDSGAALMALLLAAVNEGLGAGFLGSHAIPGLKEFLDLSPGTEITGLVTLGHPVVLAPTGSALRPRDERVITWMS